ncbi:MAG: membrane protein insertase YidC [Desulfohalobiaceae bacterium]
MDNKRMILAIALSIAVLVLWNILFPPQPQRVEQPQTEQTTRQEPSPEQTRQAEAPLPETSATGAFSAQGESLVIDTPLYRAELNTAGGVLEHFLLKQYKTSIEPDAENVDLVTRDSLSKAPMGLLWNQTPIWREARWSHQGRDLTLDAQGTGSLTLVGEMEGLTFTRTLTFRGDSYAIEEQTRIQSDIAASLRGTLSYTMASYRLTMSEDRYDRTQVVYMTPDGLEQVHKEKELGPGIVSPVPVVWGGIASNYFLLSVLPPEDGTLLKGKLEDQVFRTALSQDVTVEPGQAVELKSTYYLGPKTKKALGTASPKLESAINYGWFDFIAKPLMQVLKFFHGYVGNWGGAIILLTVLIKIVFWPLSHKSYKSMEQMKKLQPMMAKLREKYKDDKKKLNEELMGLYKTYKVNPAGGCLPMLLQIPVFIALYQGLLGAIELRHAAFISHLPFTDLPWLADLSAKDPFYITPLVMGATMFLQQKLSPAPGDPTQAKIMMLMPVVFTFIFLNFPSGLVLYWLVNNVLSIAQQWWLTRKA